MRRKVQISKEAYSAMIEAFYLKHGRMPEPEDKLFDEEDLKNFMNTFPQIIEKAINDGNLPLPDELKEGFKEKMFYWIPRLKKAKNFNQFHKIFREMVGLKKGEFYKFNSDMFEE